MTESNNEGPGLATLARRVGRTFLGALENRGELLAVEWQLEKERLLQVIFYAGAVIFLAVMGMMLLTATIIFWFSEQYRLYVAAAFTVFYLGGAVALFFALKSLLKREPFEESLHQLKKDRTLFDPLE